MIRKLLNQILYWRLKHIGNRTFLVIASVLVGTISALAAVILKTAVHLLHGIPHYYQLYSNNNFWLFFFPILGVIVTIIVIKIFFQGKIEKGLGSIIYSVSHKSSRVEKTKTYSQLITSGFTVGLGGSAGLEAPIAITGAAIGSNISTFFNLGHKERTILLACGAASGIAAVFNSPIAGVLFALEVILTDFTVPSFIPLLISTATATIVSKLLYKGQLFYLISNDWYFHAIPFYIVLGIICGLLSVYMKRVTLSMESFFNSPKKHAFKRITGLVLLGLLIFLLPPLFGEGYSTIESLLKGSYSDLFNNSIFGAFKNNTWGILSFTLMIILVKVIATSLTTDTGGNGGIFAPSLFTGALTGFGLSFFVNTIGISNLNVSNFVVVGMAGVMSGVVHAPLTAIFLIAEITGGYVLFIPLMIVSALAYFITRIFEPYSVYTKKLAQKGELLGEDKDSNVLKYLKVEDLIENDFITLNVNDKLQNLIDAFSISNRNVFPVINDKGEFFGIISLDNVKDLLFRTSLYNELKLSVITQKIITIDYYENMDSVMAKFEKTKLWNIPVLKGKVYMGFLSRSNILTYYRQTLKRTGSGFL